MSMTKLFVFCFFALMSLPATSSQPGFLSIDCGASAPYVDDKGISWIPDGAYMSVGVNANVSLDPSLGLEGTELTTLRYFPDTKRTSFCYVLPTTIGQTYSLRPRFYYGSYTNQPSVSFNVAIDTYESDLFSFSPRSTYLFQEYIFQAKNHNVQLCLIRKSVTENPFISSLELRPFLSTMYSKWQDGNALMLQFRSNYGATTNSVVRYPDDPYDRQWFGVSSTSLLNVTSQGFVDKGLAPDKPPEVVMNTALMAPPATSTNTITPGIYISFTSLFTSATDRFYIALYFSEMATQLREFDVILNGQLLLSNFNIYASGDDALHVPVEFFLNNTLLADGQVNITMSQSANSTLPPICNAAEMYHVTPVALPRTFVGDVLAIASLLVSFNLTSWTGDPCLLVPYDWLNCTSTSPPRVSSMMLSHYALIGSIPSSLASLTDLSSLWLDGNALSGEIPNLSKLTNLETIHLENNSLEGPIPDWLGSMPNLRELYLQNNKLSGNVPKSLLNNKNLIFQYSPGNSGLCINGTCPSGNKSSNLGLIVGVVVGVLAIIVIVIGVLVFCLCFNKGHVSKVDGTSLAHEEGSSMLDSTSTEYTLAQVMKATNNHAKVLGKGGFGLVYYGKLPNGREVAVKVCTKDSVQGFREFINEVDLLTRVHHKNLVDLVGYCKEGENMSLLYEYMPNGTVQEHLYGFGKPSERTPLNWKARLDIGLNAAQGLEYLHVGCNPSIFHRDVKSVNILLNDKMVAKVADFGLSKSTRTTDNVTHVSTLVKGTIGYLDPEYFNTNKLTDKSDVYSFGIVLLELICGRPAFVPSRPENERRIDQWVRPHLETGTIEKIVDPVLGDKYNVESMWKVADLAMQCVEPKSIHRPRMSVICQELRDALEMESASNKYSSFS